MAPDSNSTSRSRGASPAPSPAPSGKRARSPRERRLRRLGIAGWILVAIVLAGFIVVEIVVPQLAGASLLASGSAAPLIQLDDAAGHHHDVYAEAGPAPIVVNFFATDCGDCRDEVTAWCAAAAAHPGIDFVGVEAAGHGAPDISAFAHDLGGGCLTANHVVLLADPRGALSATFHVVDTPTAYLIRSGHVVAAGVGADQLATVVGSAGAGT